MQTYEIALIINRVPTDVELLGLAPETLDTHDIVGFESEGGVSLAHLAVDADSLATAIMQAVQAVETMGDLELQVVGVSSNDVVSLKDIATRTGRTYESVRLLATGSRGAGGFPPALSPGQWALYSWSDVAAWFAKHYGFDAPGPQDRELVAADLLIRARRILAGDENRDQLARLLVA